MLMRKSKQHPQQKTKLNNSRKTDITMIYSLSMGTQKLRMLITKRNYKNKLMIRKKKLKNSSPRATTVLELIGFRDDAIDSILSIGKAE